MPSYRGLTWDHPRGTDALRASVVPPSPSGTTIDIDWEVHSLAGFEAASIDAIAAEHDLLVIDHPHLGTAVAHEALAPLDAHLDQGEVDRIERASIGSTLDSYRLDGRLWALPLDAAAQVAVTRRQFADQTPADWDEVERFSRDHRVALSLAGPHALATFASACCAFGAPPASGEEFVGAQVGVEVLDQLSVLAGRAPVGAAALDPIEMLERMATTDDIDHVPLIFGYVGSSTSGARGLAFSDAPTAPGGSVHGSVLGGAGLAFSRRCVVTDELVAYARWLVADETQRAFVPAHAGQPSALAAWTDADLDASSAGFYAGTVRTVQGAWVRPRHDGYVPFQVEASQVVRSVLDGRTAAPAGVERINELYRRSLAGAPLAGVSA